MILAKGVPTSYNCCMTTITLEVSDQLAAEIEPIRDELPVLLAITRQLFRPAGDGQVHTSSVYLAYKQLLDFLASEPTHERISRFTISPQAQARVHELLDKHGEGELNEEEQAELRVYHRSPDRAIYAKLEARKKRWKQSQSRC